jgi:hypothetical protein
MDPEHCPAIQNAECLETDPAIDGDYQLIDYLLVANKVHFCF